MTGAFLNRARAQALMQAAGIDALVLLQPENIQYATGAAPGVATLFRRAGAAIALVPADASVPAAAVMPDLAKGAVAAGSDVADITFLPIWVGTTTLEDGPSNRPLADRLTDRHGGPERPATFDRDAAYRVLADQLRARGLESARLGVEQDFLPVSDAAALAAALPKATIVDGSAIVNRLRVIKSPREIALLREACSLSEHAFRLLVPEIKVGVPRDVLGEFFLQAVRTEARVRGHRNLTSVWEYISVGANPWGSSKPVESGDVVKADCGAVLSGYSSDSARTYVVGRATEDMRTVYHALKSAWDLGYRMLGPGVRLADVHSAMIQCVRANGLPNYRRGHFGHGLGQSVFSEEWPFIAADSDAVAEPGMVLALETPFYIDGLGGFIVEDQVLITDQGAETMNSLPYEFLEL